MEVKPGYKQTEVGVIPEEWEVDVIGDAFDISGGLSASRDQLSSNGHCYLHYGDIHKSQKNIIDVRSEYLDIPKLDVPLSRVPSKSLLADGDVVFVDASEDDEGTSKHLVVVNPEAIPYISGLHTIVAKSKGSSFDNAYKRYCFQTRDLRRQFYYYAVGTKVSGISKTNIKKVFIPRPPLPEQRAIAGALSDVDALIGALDRLIAKKRDLKQAAVQQLLTPPGAGQAGQTRLPGFSGEWELRPIGSFSAFVTKGATPTTYGFNWEGDGVLFLRSECVSDEGLDLAQSMFVSEAAHAALIRGEVRSGDILMTITGNVGRMVHLKPDFGSANINQHIARIRVRNPAIRSDFVYHWLSQPSVRAYYTSITTGQAYPQISLKQVRETQVPVPPLAEQIAIAEVLSDMDADLVAVKQRRDKTRALKQGMMQELLTGRIRLV